MSRHLQHGDEKFHKSTVYMEIDENVKEFLLSIWKTYLPILLKIIVSGWFAWLIVNYYEFGMPEVAIEILDLLRFIEQSLFATTVGRILEFLAFLISSIWIDFELAEHARYAFNFLALKLIGDAQVDRKRFSSSIKIRKTDPVWKKIIETFRPKKMRFLTLELFLGFCIACLSAIIAGYFTFDQESMSFAFCVIGGYLAYELFKVFLHIGFDLYEKGWKSNAKRYFFQFFAPTLASAFCAYAIGHLITSSVGNNNNSLLVVFLFIVCIVIQQFLSATFTYYKSKKNGTASNFSELGQVVIGKQILHFLIMILGWMLLANLFAKYTVVTLLIIIILSLIFIFKWLSTQS